MNNLDFGQTILAAANSTFAIGGVSCSVGRFVETESFMLRINICGKNPPLHKAANRYTQLFRFVVASILKYYN
jgi:hypothetical protein